MTTREQALERALTDLFNEQYGGPPLPERAREWSSAMQQAKLVLGLPLTPPTEDQEMEEGP